MLPLRHSDETSVVHMAQSGRSETAENASAKTQAENHARFDAKRLIHHERACLEIDL